MHCLMAFLFLFLSTSSAYSQLEYIAPERRETENIMPVFSVSLYLLARDLNDRIIEEKRLKCNLLDECEASISSGTESDYMLVRIIKVTDGVSVSVNADRYSLDSVSWIYRSYGPTFYKAFDENGMAILEFPIWYKELVATSIPMADWEKNKTGNLLVVVKK